MKITLESTDRVVEVNGVSARVWEGRTERGIAVTAIIPRIAVKVGADASQFEAELKECAPLVSRMPDAWPSRFVL